MYNPFMSGIVGLSDKEYPQSKPQNVGKFCRFHLIYSSNNFYRTQVEIFTMVKINLMEI